MANVDRNNNYIKKAETDSTEFSNIWAQYEEADAQLASQQKMRDEIQKAYDKNTIDTGVKKLEF